MGAAKGWTVPLASTNTACCPGVTVRATALPAGTVADASPSPTLTIGAAAKVAVPDF